MSTPARRGGTATSSFGVSRREGHDASAFYERFSAPEISRDSEISAHASRNQLWVGDARDMDAHGDVADNSVALVVTSPPYFAGKEYEEAVGEGHVPASYKDYLQMLRDVFAECKRKLEPGGRIAVNVANLGRKPYRSLSSDVIGILQDDHGLLLRGEVIWRKAEGAAGNCAWGSFQRPANPVLRDLTERVVIASKGRFRPRAVGCGEVDPGTAVAGHCQCRRVHGRHHRRMGDPGGVGHPCGAPRPVPGGGLPERLIDLYTYRGDLVLDPFMGAGTTAVAAVRTGRHYAGFDTDGDYLDVARQRIAREREQLLSGTGTPRWEAEGNSQARLFNPPDGGDEPGVMGTRVSSNGAGHRLDDDFQARAVLEGRKAQEKARQVLSECGFGEIHERVSFSCGVEVNFSAVDREGRRWLFDVSGAFSVTRRPGLRRTDTLWKALGKAAVLDTAGHRQPLVLLTTDRPAASSAGHRALDAVTGPGKPVHAVIEMEDPDDLRRLAALADGGDSGDGSAGVA